MIIKMIVLGNLPLATKIIRHLMDTACISLVGAIHPEINKNYPDTDDVECAYEFCKQHNIPRLTMSDVKKMSDLHLAISARNNDILKKWVLDKFSIGVVNCHGGYLPDYKGVGGHIFPLVNGEKFTGGTIHWMNEKIDDGDIIDRAKIQISPNDTGLTLFKKINDCIFDAYKNNIASIVNGTANRVVQSNLSITTESGKSFYYYTRDILELKEKKNLNELEKRALFWYE